MEARFYPRKLTVSINNIGSGCLFQPISKEYCYVLTARHVVEEVETYKSSPQAKDNKLV